jgi:hypothetical protein
MFRVLGETWDRGLAQPFSGQATMGGCPILVSRFVRDRMGIGMCLVLIYSHPSPKTGERVGQPRRDPEEKDGPAPPGRQPATNEIWRKRINFFENAQIPDGTYVANEVGFYVRLSCKWGSSGNTFSTDVTGDNVLGMGTTKTSWNLQ